MKTIHVRTQEKVIAAILDTRRDHFLYLKSMMGVLWVSIESCVDLLCLLFLLLQVVC